MFFIYSLELLLKFFKKVNIQKKNHRTKYDKIALGMLLTKQSTLIRIESSGESEKQGKLNTLHITKDC